MECVDLGGRSLRYGIYGDPTKSRGFFFLNGRTEYVEKYDYLPKDLDLWDDAFFVTMDHQGQGLSDGKKGHVATYEDYAKDAASVAKLVLGHKPYYLLGHSMGGLIALFATLKGYLKPDTIHLLSPLFGVYHPCLSPFHMKIIGKIAHFFAWEERFVMGHNPALKPFSVNPLTSDEARYSKIRKSPYGFYPITYGWLSATHEAFEECQKNLERLSCPVFLTFSQDDRIVSSEETKLWIEKAKKSPVFVSEKELSGGHELLSEKKHLYDQVLHRIQLSFSSDPTASGPSSRINS